jgi:hypothetical protein
MICLITRRRMANQYHPCPVTIRSRPVTFSPKGCGVRLCRRSMSALPLVYGSFESRACFGVLLFTGRGSYGLANSRSAACRNVSCALLPCAGGIESFVVREPVDAETTEEGRATRAGNANDFARSPRGCVNPRGLRCEELRSDRPRGSGLDWFRSVGFEPRPI